MKFSQSLLSLASLALAAALPQASTPASTPSTTPSPTPTPSASGSFATTSGIQFVIDGEAGYFPGSNAYWIGFLKNNSDVDHVFDRVASSGLRILRVWGFNDVNTVPTDGSVYFQLHQNGKSTINTGKDGLQRLDYVVQSAEKHGIKLIINFVNYWDDYGGMNAYVKAYGAADKTEWFENEDIQAAYQAYIEAVVGRYIDSPAVFAWELANEPRCKGCETSVMHNWTAETSAFIKGLDAKHLVCIGDEGFGLDTGSDGSYPFLYSEGSDFAAALSIDTIDFGTIHLYPDSWDRNNSWGNLWITSHAAACAAAGKPCLLEEYGVTSDHCAIEKQWQHTARNATGIAADLYWQFGDKLSGGLSPNDGHTLYYGSEQFECLVTEHVEAIDKSGK
ncbi:hypothetical protein BDW71DRAFT_165319 [Aspergillus fruticulosus]